MKTIKRQLPQQEDTYVANKKKKGRLKKILIGVGILLVLVVIVGSKFSGKKNGEEIKTVNVKIGDVVDKLTETGNIQLLRTVEVKSKIAGTINEILVKEGDPVIKGQVLCIIDPDPTQTLLLFQKRANVDRTRINLDQAKKELVRKRELAKTSYVSQKEVEDADNVYLICQNAYNLASQELLIMEKEIDTAGTGSEERIVSSKVKAPYDGYITQRYVEEGFIVTSGISSVVAGTNLFQIGDPSTKIIRANISEVDIGRVAVKDLVDIKLDAYPDTSFAGVIKHISPVGTLAQGRNVVAFKTEIEIIDEDPRLMPGMSCDVDVIISYADSVRFLPVESVYVKKESEENAAKTITHIAYIRKPQEEIDKAAPKKKFGFISEQADPLDAFEMNVITVGLKSDSRYQVPAVYDTTTVVVLDAEKMYKAFEQRDKENKEKEKNEQEKTKSDETKNVDENNDSDENANSDENNDSDENEKS